MSAVFSIKSTRSNTPTLLLQLFFLAVALHIFSIFSILIVKSVLSLFNIILPPVFLNIGLYSLTIILLLIVFLKFKSREICIEIGADNVISFINGSDVRKLNISEIRQIDFVMDDRGTGWRLKNGFSTFNQDYVFFIYYLIFKTDRNSVSIDFNNYPLEDLSQLIEYLIKQNVNIRIDEDVKLIAKQQFPEIHQILGNFLLKWDYRKLIQEGKVQVLN